ncbi:MAG TPA: DUF512 domain-containing protein [Candidatus Avacidaminococcus intestinavium]|uniref:DUF512 domain-containing protein n=1 Tax=Candidatus Avacidaminococcus intestinavium TaxID=2840684 RepID=A0A9D1SL89_9FIRM|nr:DUF512 domain-containing protein [Candidatus Avacidaminococcus intestinavium]
MKGLISAVRPNTLAAAYDIKAKERLIKVNGIAPLDLIELSYLINSEKVTLEIENTNGQIRQISIEKNLDEDLGLEFETAVFNGTRYCHNKCVFCFVDQMIPNMRSSLYERDDDFRLSFLYGNFLTLTNMSEQDYDRIISTHLSPLYVSVHATDPETRICMMKNKNAGKIMSELKRLTDNGIKVHTQIVLCPGYNDGPILEKTFNDLFSLAPMVETMAVVPVGLTKERKDLPELRVFTPHESKSIIKTVQEWQKKARAKSGKSFIYLGDEFYVNAEMELPASEEYDGFPQIENGIGLSRSFIDDWYKTTIYNEPKSDMYPALIPVGTSAFKILKPLIQELNLKFSLQHQLLPIDNNFFGGAVNVTGLLTATDILKQIKHLTNYKRIILPGKVLNHDKLFLDNTTFEEFKDNFDGQVGIAETARDLKRLLVEEVS